MSVPPRRGGSQSSGSVRDGRWRLCGHPPGEDDPTSAPDAPAGTFDRRAAGGALGPVHGGDGARASPEDGTAWRELRVCCLIVPAPFRRAAWLSRESNGERVVRRSKSGPTRRVHRGPSASPGDEMHSTFKNCAAEPEAGGAARRREPRAETAQFLPCGASTLAGRASEGRPSSVVRRGDHEERRKGRGSNRCNTIGKTLARHDSPAFSQGVMISLSNIFKSAVTYDNAGARSVRPRAALYETPELRQDPDRSRRPP
ncbi:hypothetical protein THAOC_08748, partial [Thalassiosira oceanica]